MHNAWPTDAAIGKSASHVLCHTLKHNGKYVAQSPVDWKLGMVYYSLSQNVFLCIVCLFVHCRSFSHVDWELGMLQCLNNAMQYKCVLLCAHRSLGHVDWELGMSINEVAVLLLSPDMLASVSSASAQHAALMAYRLAPELQRQ